jgi:hypothetical protein
MLLDVVVLAIFYFTIFGVGKLHLLSPMHMLPCCQLVLCCLDTKTASTRLYADVRSDHQPVCWVPEQALCTSRLQWSIRASHCSWCYLSTPRQRHIWTSACRGEGCCLSWPCCYWTGRCFLSMQPEAVPADRLLDTKRSSEQRY